MDFFNFDQFKQVNYNLTFCNLLSISALSTAMSSMFDKSVIVLKF